MGNVADPEAVVTPPSAQTHVPQNAYRDRGLVLALPGALALPGVVIPALAHLGVNARPDARCEFVHDFMARGDEIGSQDVSTDCRISEDEPMCLEILQSMRCFAWPSVPRSIHRYQSSLLLPDLDFILPGVFYDS